MTAALRTKTFYRHNGGEATDTFLALRGMDKEERDRLRKSLLAYCKLDTMAMVMLWQRLREFCHI